MAAVMEEIGGDGFLIQDPLTRKAIIEITDGLVPTLQRRGLTRAAYSARAFPRQPAGVLTRAFRAF